MPPAKRKLTPSDDLDELTRRQKSEQARQYARRPKKLGEVLPTLMARRGYARIQSAGELTGAWQAAVGAKLAGMTRVGRVQRGALEILVANSAVLQELTFGQEKLLATVQALAPDAGVKKLRFKAGKLA